MLIVPSVSLEYLRVPIAGAAGAQPVELAVIDSGADEPAEDDWLPADEWDGTTAKILIGPGGTLELLDGTYRVWVRITATPEVPVIRAGLLRVT